jgi:hypothetical protein
MRSAPAELAPHVVELFSFGMDPIAPERLPAVAREIESWKRLPSAAARERTAPQLRFVLSRGQVVTVEKELDDTHAVNLPDGERVLVPRARLLALLKQIAEPQ